MKCKTHIIKCVKSFNIDNSMSSLLGPNKEIYRFGKYTAIKNVDIMGFKTIIFHCNIISGSKDNGEESNILYTLNLTEIP